MRYALDLLDRIAAITNWASASGPVYVTHYKYDAVGNITNIIDPFSGQTSFTYDQVGRRTQRVLPNGIVTTWQYNWKDQVTNIVHKTSGGTVLASVAYIRARGGEPLQITREDGSYVILGYDGALRLTNEVYYNSTSVAQATNSYGYDADGNRILFAQSGTVLTNGVSAGYQITAVKNAANGSTVESYGYDAGGRITNIVRSSSTWNFGYNSADQIIAATNSTTGTWVVYQQDGGGQRTLSTNSSGIVRRFVVAATPDGNLENPLLISDANGELQQGYVFLGDQPMMNYASGGAATYYLEDGMGSVIGIAPASSPSTANTTRLFYDGFGNSRLTNGPAPAMPTGSGGDFRFHGAWLEADSGLYYMRAREYDPQTGRFTSKDDREGLPEHPETLNPYIYAANNPFVYTDPSGEFTMLELNITMSMDDYLEALKSSVVAYAQQRIESMLWSMMSSMVQSEIDALLPGNWKAALKELSSLAGDGLGLGNAFGDLGYFALCHTMGEIPGMKDQIHNNVYVAASSGRGGRIRVGDPLTAGKHCENIENEPAPEGRTIGIKYGIPDFIIGDKPIRSVAPISYNEAFAVGDFKWSLKAMYDDYARTSPRHPNQFKATIGYAQKHTYMHDALFIVATNKGKNAIAQREKGVLVALLVKQFIDQQVFPAVFILQH